MDLAHARLYPWPNGTLEVARLAGCKFSARLWVCNTWVRHVGISVMWTMKRACNYQNELGAEIYLQNPIPNPLSTGTVVMSSPSMCNWMLYWAYAMIEMCIVCNRSSAFVINSADWWKLMSKWLGSILEWDWCKDRTKSPLHRDCVLKSYPCAKKVALRWLRCVLSTVIRMP